MATSYATAEDKKHVSSIEYHDIIKYFVIILNELIYKGCLCYQWIDRILLYV